MAAVLLVMSNLGTPAQVDIGIHQTLAKDSVETVRSCMVKHAMMETLILEMGVIANVK